jgi:hypothetical protein
VVSNKLAAAGHEGLRKPIRRDCRRAWKGIPRSRSIANRNPRPTRNRIKRGLNANALARPTLSGRRLAPTAVRGAAARWDRDSDVDTCGATWARSVPRVAAALDNSPPIPARASNPVIALRASHGGPLTSIAIDRLHRGIADGLSNERLQHDPNRCHNRSSIR